jgi:hypothetical protein
VDSDFQRALELERQGRYDEAFAAFAEANRLRRETLNPAGRLAETERRLGIVRSLFTAEWLAEQKGGHPSDEPIFIIGMPRSGSTLIEQILVAHPHVTGMGECHAMVAASRGLFPYPISGPKLPRHWRAIGDRYLAQLRQQGRRRSRRVVDKSLNLFEAVGLLDLVFPHAVILHAVRDPLDTCLSIWRRHFASANDFAYDLGDIAAYYGLYRQFMRHWQAVLPGRVIEVRHETLIADPDAEIRALLNAVKLPFDERCLRPDLAEERVKDGAFDQMATPINAEAVGRWRRYERQLEPLIGAVRPYLGVD